METQTVGKASTKTTLVFGLVGAPVALYKTTADKPPAEKFDAAGPNGGALRLVDKPTAAPVEDTPQGAPLGVQRDPGSEAPPPGDAPVAAFPADKGPGEFRRVLKEEDTGIEVERADVRRGIRREDGSFMDLTAGLEAIDERTKLDEMRVVAFIDVGQVPRERVQGSYYLAATEPGGPKVLRLLYEGMRRCRRVAVVKWTKTSRQALGVIVPHAKTETLMVLQLAWAEDWRAPTPKILSHLQAQVTESEVDAAAQLFLAMADTRDAMDVLRDDRREQIEELVARAEAGEVFEMPALPPRPDADAEVGEAIFASAERADEFAAAR